MPVTALRDRPGATVRVAIDRFLAFSHCANPNTCHAYTGVLDRLVLGRTSTVT